MNLIDEKKGYALKPIGTRNTFLKRTLLTRELRLAISKMASCNSNFLYSKWCSYSSDEEAYKMGRSLH